MAKTFRVTFDIPETKLGTVVGLISGEVSNLIIRDTDTIQTNGTTPAKGKRLMSPKKSGSRGDTCLKMVRGELAKHKVGTEVSYEVIKKLMVAKGYNPNSHSSVISSLVGNGEVERTKPQTLRVLKVTG